MGGDVEDAGLRVLERRADVDAPPLGLLSSSPASPHAEAIASNVPPMVSVAEVSTAVDVLKQPAAQQP